MPTADELVAMWHELPAVMDRDTVGPWKVCYWVDLDGGVRREMPPARNLPTFGAALDRAAVLWKLGYDVRPPVLDTCG